ncbi:MAG: hypothetical protein ACI8ZX_000682 [Planctomycetota bacterium]|jgi:hypothetical protein
MIFALGKYNQTLKDKCIGFVSVVDLSVFVVSSAVLVVSNCRSCRVGYYPWRAFAKRA